MAEPNAMVTSRHRFRIWKASLPATEKQVHATHRFAQEKRKGENNAVTHKIDLAVEGERENIGSSPSKK
jgi:hypothetical protein